MNKAMTNKALMGFSQPSSFAPLRLCGESFYAPKPAIKAQIRKDEQADDQQSIGAVFTLFILCVFASLRQIFSLATPRLCGKSFP